MNNFVYIRQQQHEVEEASRKENDDHEEEEEVKIAEQVREEIKFKFRIIFSQMNAS